MNASHRRTSLSGGLAATDGTTKHTELWNFYETTALNSSFLSMQGSDQPSRVYSAMMVEPLTDGSKCLART